MLTIAKGETPGTRWSSGQIRRRGQEERAESSGTLFPMETLTHGDLDTGVSVRALLRSEWLQ